MNAPKSRPMLVLLTKARNRYRRLPPSLRRPVDMALGTGVYKRPMVRRGALFVHVPKSAGTSVSQTLFGLKAVGHYTAAEAQAYDPSLFARLFKFSFVRHPISRAYSAYRYLRTGGTPDTPVAMPHLYKHLATATFEQYVDWLESIDVNHSNPVVGTQAKYVCNRNGEILVDFVGRFETIERDFQTVCERLGLQCSLQQRNISSSENALIDPALIERLRIIYQQDFRIFDYE